MKDLRDLQYLTTHNVLAYKRRTHYRAEALIMSFKCFVWVGAYRVDGVASEGPEALLEVCVLEPPPLSPVLRQLACYAGHFAAVRPLSPGLRLKSTCVLRTEIVEAKHRKI